MSVRSHWVELYDFFFQAEDGIRDGRVTGVQTCALPIYRRRSNVLANPPFLRNAHLEIGTGAGASAVRIELHLVGGSALVGHYELREIARYTQAIRFHLFHCPGPAITRFRLKQGKRQGRRLWIYDL